MDTQKTTVPHHPANHRFWFIALAAFLILALATTGIWWSLKTDSSETPAGPSAAALPNSTRMGSVELQTANLATMGDFYVDAVGLDVLNESATHLSLGRNAGEAGKDVEVLSLHADSSLPADVYTEAGLYHSAILYPDEHSLAQALLSVATVAPQSYSGSADHAVSLAFYFTDPDGNGLELYTDTPEDEWVWKDGLVQMGAAALDPNAFLAEHLGTASSDTASPETDGSSDRTATIGHVHLRVGDLDAARDFYADTLGFAVTAESDGALFYAAGGYHHHIATNTWSSAGAGSRPDSTGLGSLTISLDNDAALQAVGQRLNTAGVDFLQDRGIITVDDPWGNTVRIIG